MTAGIVSEENLAALRKRGGQYLVGTPRSKLKGMERELLQGPWTQVREEVEAQLVAMPGGTETYVLCRTRRGGRKNGPSAAAFRPHGTSADESGAARGERPIERPVEN